MYSPLKATIVLGALLSAGMLMAQQSDPNQAPAPSEQSAPAQAAPDQSAPAQPMRHAPNANKQAHHLAKTLGLSHSQVAQIKPILAERIQQMQSLRADPSLSPQDRRQKTREIMHDSRSKIEAVLNDSQRQQFEQMLAQRRNRRNGAPAEAPQG
jgi:periplasmic protein CpxP/Spy